MYAADIFQHGFHFEGRERTGGEDLLSPVGVVPTLQILLDLLPAVGLEVDVHVAHGFTGTLKITVTDLTIIRFYNVPGFNLPY